MFITDKNISIHKTQQNLNTKYNLQLNNYEIQVNE